MELFGRWGASLSVVSTPDTARPDLMVIFWIIGRLVSHMIEVASFLVGCTTPLHIPHINNRAGMFVMLFLGESVIQIVTTNIPNKGIPEAFVAACGFAFMTSFNYAVHYFHTQPHNPKRHIMRRSAVGTWLWYRLHKNLAFFVFVFGVGFKTMFTKLEGGMYPNYSYYWLFCSGCAISMFLTVVIRRLNNPSPRRVDKISYLATILASIIIQILPIISVPSKTHILWLIFPVFWLSFGVAIGVLLFSEAASDHDDDEGPGADNMLSLDTTTTFVPFGEH